eukprot:CAMPEP_0185158680 /NCGR_PEP_ID=MMETSP1139-20130426/2561_1 /TAXON_ID=298111 /ORGANISM="Pavlova sp., Strain CCMP459" /LENGTH=465 /DNA_ID=CAMNT_0027723825 /DNA_START=95 /DNA_END=1492 /DNA_ORIENTATION=-
MTRRAAAGTVAAAWAVTFLQCPGPALAVPEGIMSDIAELGKQAKGLREAARTQGARATSSITSGLDATLLPLQAKMMSAAPKASDAYTQAQLMQGHLLELKQALTNGDFAEYKSKSTKQTYPGGKVERELEEVSETFDDFMRLMGVKPVGATDLSTAWAGRYSDPNHPRGYRDITVTKGVATITGRDEPDGAEWRLTANVDGDSALIDFSPKGGPKGLLAKLGAGKISFPDGNAWTKMSPWAGRFSDPNHPKGYRDITVSNGVATIVGVDEPGDAPWKLTAKVDGDSALIDFSPKGGPKDLLAKLGVDKIVFPDGNAWPGPSERSLKGLKLSRSAKDDRATSLIACASPPAAHGTACAGHRAARRGHDHGLQLDGQTSHVPRRWCDRRADGGVRSASQPADVRCNEHEALSATAQPSHLVSGVSTRSSHLSTQQEQTLLTSRRAADGAQHVPRHPCRNALRLRRL